MNLLRSRFSITLVINFLFVTAISLGTASLLNYHVTRRDLIRQTQVNLRNESRELSLLVGELVLEHIELLETLSIDGIIRNELRAINQTYGQNLGEIVSQLEQRNDQWINAPDEDPFVQSILKSPISYELEEFVKLFPDYSDVLITDRYGALMGATQHMDDYYQGDETWWQTVWNEGKGAIYVSQPFLEETLQVYVTEIAVPVYKDGTVVGVLHGYYRLDRALTKVLETIEFETGGSRLYISDSEYLGAEGIQTDAPLSPAILANTLGGTLPYEGQSTFLSAEPVHAITETNGAKGKLVDQAIETLHWYVVVYQSSAEALQPLTNAARVALITAGGALILAVVLGIVLAQIVSNPIRLLIRTAQKVQSDTVTSNDLKQLDKIASKNDDMGELASVFRDMSLVIMEREESLANEIASLQAQVESGSQQANDLELAYYEALRKKAGWLRQQFLSDDLLHQRMEAIDLKKTVHRS
ncbi:MAG: hypothetical protein AAF821_14470 [Cyanobacteria bacterium P01_D01_bin.156]